MSNDNTSAMNHDARAGRPAAVRVFVSSTFRDTLAERDHLAMVVFPELKERLLTLGMGFYDVDLRWGAPTSYRDEDRADSWNYCKQVIDRTYPLFISIIGQCHGAMTEMEIRHAVLEHRDCQRRSYSYVRETPVPLDVARSIRKRFADDDKQGEIERLLAEIRACGRPVRPYRCRWHEDQFRDLDEFGSLVLEDLWSGVLRSARYFPVDAWRSVLGHGPRGDQRYDDDSAPLPEALWRELVEAARPPAASALTRAQRGMRSFADSRTSHFGGRAAELRAALDFATADRSAGNLLVVEGAVGMGKSAFLAELSQQLHLEHPAYTVVSNFVGATQESTSVRNMLSYLTETLREANAITPEITDPHPSSEAGLRDLLSRALRRYLGPQKLVLIVDAIDQIPGEQDLRWIPNDISPFVKVILSATAGALAGAAPQARTLALGPLQREDVAAIIDQYFAEYGKEISTSLRDKISAFPPCGTPLYLIALLHQFRLLSGDDLHAAIESIMARVQRERPDSISLLSWTLERLEQAHGAELVGTWCGFLAIGRVGMKSDELADLVDARLGPVARARTHLVQRALGDYLFERGDVLDFFHRELRLAVAARYLDEPARRDLHRRAADAFARAGFTSARALDELAFHYHEAERFAELYELLLDKEFRNRKVASKDSVHALCEDLQRGMRAAFRAGDRELVQTLGLMHADYAEGRGGHRKVAELCRGYPDRPLETRRELRRYPEEVRFRALLHLALAEAQAGHVSDAELLVREAGELRRIETLSEERGFLVGAIATMYRSGVRAALPVLRVVLDADRAAEAAADIARELEPDARPAVVRTGLDWLREERRSEVDSSTDACAAYRAVFEAAADLAPSALRDEIVDDLLRLVDGITSLVDSTPVPQHEQFATIIRHLATVVFDAVKGPRRLHFRLVPVLRAEAGACLVRMGDRARGDDYLQRALDSLRKLSSFPLTARYVLRPLLTHPGCASAASELVHTIAPKDVKDRLSDLLEEAADARRGPALDSFLRAARQRIVDLPSSERGALPLLLNNALRRAGQTIRMDPYRNDIERFLVSRTPGLAPGYRLRVVQLWIGQEGFGGDPRWLLQGRWLQRMARWLSQADPERAVSVANDVLDEVRAINADMAAEFALRLAGRLADGPLISAVLQKAIDACRELPAARRRELRRTILESIKAARNTRDQLTALDHWVATADPGAEAIAAMEVWEWFQPAQPELRRRLLVRTADMLLKAGNQDHAQRYWLESIGIEQDRAGDSAAWGAWSVRACVRGSDEEFDAVLRAAGSTNPDIAVPVISAASDSLTDVRKLAQMTRRVVSLEWIGPRERQRGRLLASLAGAWVRLGYPARAARLLTSILRSDRGWDDSCTRIAMSIENNVAGRQILQKLARVRGSQHSEAAVLVHALAELTDRSLRLQLLRELQQHIVRWQSGTWVRLRAQAALAHTLSVGRDLDWLTEVMEGLQVPDPLEKGQPSTRMEVHTARDAASTMFHIAAALQIFLSATTRVARPRLSNKLLSFARELVQVAFAEFLTDGPLVAPPIRDHQAARDVLLSTGAAVFRQYIDSPTTATGSRDSALALWIQLAAEFGQSRIALEVAGSVFQEPRDADQQAELLGEMAEAIALREPEHILKLWSQCCTPRQRMHVAQAISRDKYLRSQTRAPDHPVPMSRRSSHATRGGPVLRFATTVVTAAASYWGLAYAIPVPAPWRYAVVSSLVVLALIAAWFVMRKEADRPAQRVFLALVLTVIAPKLVVVAIGRRLVQWVVPNLALLAERIHRSAPRRHGENPEPSHEVIASILLSSAWETRTFDAMLTPWLAGQLDAVPAPSPEHDPMRRAGLASELEFEYAKARQYRRKQRWYARAHAKLRAALARYLQRLVVGVLRVMARAGRLTKRSR